MPGRQVKFLVIAVAALLTAFIVSGCFASRKYAASVNGTYITKEQYQANVDKIISYYETTARKLKEGEKKELKKETLDLLINEELVTQESQKKKIVVTDTQVDTYINKQKNNISDSQYQALLKKRNYTLESYREMVRYKLVSKALSDAVTKGISDPLAKKQAYDKYMQNVKAGSIIKVYETFK